MLAPAIGWRQMTIDTLLPTSLHDWCILIGSGGMVVGGATEVPSSAVNVVSGGGVVLALAGLGLKALRIWQADRREQREKDLKYTEMKLHLEIAEEKSKRAEKTAYRAMQELTKVRQQGESNTRRVGKHDKAIHEMADSGQFPGINLDSGSDPDDMDEVL